MVSLAYDCSYTSYKMGELVKNGADPILVKFMFEGTSTTGSQALYTIRAATLEGRDGLSSIHEAEWKRGTLYNRSGRDISTKKEPE